MPRLHSLRSWIICCRNNLSAMVIIFVDDSTSNTTICWLFMIYQSTFHRSDSVIASSVIPSATVRNPHRCTAVPLTTLVTFLLLLFFLLLSSFMVNSLTWWKCLICPAQRGYIYNFHSWLGSGTKNSYHTYSFHYWWKNLTTHHGIMKPFCYKCSLSISS